MTTNASITSGQEKQFKRFVEDAADRALAAVAPDKDDLQRLIEQGDEFQKDLIASIRRLTLTDPFADEEKDSEYGYPDGYQVKPIREQVIDLMAAFPHLSLDSSLYFIEKVLPTLTLPQGAEGWFAIPRWDKIAPTYGEAVEKVLAALASTRKFNNYREGQLGPEYLRQSKRTVKMLQQLGNEQPGDILIVPAQFGLKHRGRSVRRARAVFTGNEFGIGAFGSGCMLLTNPGRLVAYEDLFIDGAGDEYSPGADGVFDKAPSFLFRGGWLLFGSYWVDDADGRCGSVSAFLPPDLRS